MSKAKAPQHELVNGIKKWKISKISKTTSSSDESNISSVDTIWHQHGHSKMSKLRAPSQNQCIELLQNRFELDEFLCDEAMEDGEYKLCSLEKMYPLNDTKTSFESEYSESKDQSTSSKSGTVIEAVSYKIEGYDTVYKFVKRNSSFNRDEIKSTGYELVPILKAIATQRGFDESLFLKAVHEVAVNISYDGVVSVFGPDTFQTIPIKKSDAGYTVGLHCIFPSTRNRNKGFYVAKFTKKGHDSQYSLFLKMHIIPKSQYQWALGGSAGTLPTSLTLEFGSKKQPESSPTINTESLPIEPPKKKRKLSTNPKPPPITNTHNVSSDLFHSKSGADFGPSSQPILQQSTNHNIPYQAQSQVPNKNTNDPLKGLYYKGMYSVQFVKFLGPETHLVCI